MSNPYHNESGRFCSRDGMLSSIHELASAGKTNEYLVLKAEFDEIDKGNVAVSRESLSSLLASVNRDNSHVAIPEDIEAAVSGVDSTPPAPQVPESIYSALSVSVLSEMVEDLGYKTSIDGEDHTQRIRDMVAASNYDDNVTYAAVYSNGLPYEEQVQLANDYNPSLYHIIAEKHGERLFEEDKAGFLAALAKIENKTDKTDSDRSNAAHLAIDLANYGNSEEDLYTAERNVNYGEFASRASGRVAASKYLNKDLANRMLTSEIESGAQNYQSVRSTIRNNLAKKGILLPEIAKRTDSPKPIAGAAPESMRAELMLLKAEKESNYRAQDKIKVLQTIIDSYADNHELLKQEVKRATRRGASNYEAQLAYDLKKRIFASNDYLNYANDLSVIKDAIAKANF